MKPKKPILFLRAERFEKGPDASVLESLLRQILPTVENVIVGTVVRILWVEGTGYAVFFDTLERLRQEEPLLYHLWSEQPEDPLLRNVRCAIPWIALFPGRLIFGAFLALGDRGDG